MGDRLVFALPGDPDALTGGYIYDKRLIQELRSIGWTVDLLRLGDDFPDPTPAAMDSALQTLAAVPPDTGLAIDGLAFGALDPVRVPEISAPLLALVHHPLALEAGVAPARSAELKASETANLAHARHVVVTSPATADTLTADFGVPRAKVTVALPGIDRPTMPAPRPDTPNRLLSVGTLIQRKGHDVLLSALAQVKDLDWRIDIVGGARDQAVAAALQDQCASLGLEDRVTFRGEIEREEIEALFRDAKLFALASRYEGYGMVFAEALSWGLPIVACAAGAVPDTVPEAAGVLTPPDDPAAFAQALRRLLTDQGAYSRVEAGAREAAANLPRWSDAGAAVDRALRAIQVERVQ